MKPSGIEWIGDIPDDWEVTKISRLYSIQLGKMLQPEKKSSGDTYEPYICAANLSSGTFRLDEVKYMWISEPEKDIYRLKRDDLLVTEGGDVGISSIWKDDISPCYFQNALHRVVPKKGNSNRFLHYWLIVLKSVGYIDLICNKSTIAHFTKEKFAQSLILSIPLQTQQKIADYLDEKCGEIDATIAKQKEIIEKLKAYKQSLISETVTKGLDKSAPLKPSGIEWIGDIPAHWEVIKTKFLFNVYGGSTPKVNVPEYWGDKITWITPGELGDDIKIVLNSKRMLSEKGLNSCGATLVSKGSIIISNRAPIGQVCLAGSELCTNQGCKSLVAKIKLSCLFFYYFFKVQSEVLNMLGNGTTFMELSTSDLLNFKIPCPTIKEQQKIADYLDSKCSQIDKYITEKQNIIQKLDAYKKSLIFECITGKHKI